MALQVSDCVNYNALVASAVIWIILCYIMIIMAITCSVDLLYGTYAL